MDYKAAADMRRTPARLASVRHSASLTPPRETKYQTSFTEYNSNGRSSRRGPRNEYIDLDRAFLSSVNIVQRKIASEPPKPRVRRQPEGFLTQDNSSLAMEGLPKVAIPETAAAEERILEKWEAWNTQMSTQLALESMVPTAFLIRGSPQNDSFQNGLPMSNHSFPIPRPESTKGASPMSQSGWRSVSRCSSRSRQSSLASTIVEPFRVGDRMTASAERRRHRPQSTKGSRELLFRRALGLEEDNNDTQSLSITSSLRSGAPAPSPLIALSTVSSTVGQNAEFNCSQLPGVKNAKVYSGATLQSTSKSQRELKLQETNDITESAVPSEMPRNEPVVEGKCLLNSDELRGAEDQKKEWMLKSRELLKSKQQPFTTATNAKSVPTRDESHDVPPFVTKTLASDAVNEKWRLPVGEAAQMICGRVVIQTVDNCSVPSIAYRGGENGDRGEESGRVSPHNNAAHNWVQWPIDRSSVTVLFVDHHVDDDQLSTYGVEVSSREECASDVLPDWNESRRRFAPVPLEDFQLPQ